MRAVVLKEYGSLENLDLMEFPDPIPGPEEIIVDVRATAVNYVDLVLIGGTYQFRPEIPFVPGKGPAGVVKAVGENVHDFAPGDRVLAMAEQGGYAEFAPIHRNNCYPARRPLVLRCGVDGASLRYRGFRWSNVVI